MEMILTGEIIDAAEAQRIGLVERVFAHDKLIEEVLKIAERIAAAPFLSVRHAKSLVRRYWDHDRSDEGARAELDAVMEITRTPDCREGIRAFLDKRAPVYRGPAYGE
jgi:enoyl-CoA hydratase